MLGLSIGEIAIVLSFIASVGTVIWRMALLHNKIANNEKTIQTCFSKLDEVRAQYKCEISELRRELEEVKQQLMNVSNTLARLEATLTYIQEDIRRK